MSRVAFKYPAKETAALLRQMDKLQEALCSVGSDEVEVKQMERDFEKMNIDEKFVFIGFLAFCGTRRKLADLLNSCVAKYSPKLYEELKEEGLSLAALSKKAWA